MRRGGLLQRTMILNYHPSNYFPVLEIFAIRRDEHLIIRIIVQGEMVTIRNRIPNVFRVRCTSKPAMEMAGVLDIEATFF